MLEEPDLGTGPGEDVLLVGALAPGGEGSRAVVEVVVGSVHHESEEAQPATIEKFAVLLLLIFISYFSFARVPSYDRTCPGNSD